MRIIVIFLICFLFINKSFAETDKSIYEKIDLFSDVLSKIDKEYVEEINQTEVMDAAINGVLQSLDPYSAYMSPEVFDEMQTETSGQFGGLGIEVSMEYGVVKVISPIDNSPASRVGVKAGDYIVKINDIQVQGKTLTEAVELMRGPVGSDIEITVRRKGVKKSIIYTITREIIKIESVKSKYIDGGIGYFGDRAIYGEKEIDTEFSTELVRSLDAVNKTQIYKGSDYFRFRDDGASFKNNFDATVAIDWDRLGGYDASSEMKSY